MARGQWPTEVSGQLSEKLIRSQLVVWPLAMSQWLTKVTRSIFGEIDQVSKCGLANGQGPVAHRSERSTFAHDMSSLNKYGVHQILDFNSPEVLQIS